MEEDLFRALCHLEHLEQLEAVQKEGKVCMHESSLLPFNLESWTTCSRDIRNTCCQQPDSMKVSSRYCCWQTR